MTRELSYCECECGKRFQVLKAPGDAWDERATMEAAYLHYVTCAVALQEAPQLIVEMAKTFIARSWTLPTLPRPKVPPSQGGRK